MGSTVSLQVKTNRPFHKAILSLGMAVIVAAIVMIGPAFSEGRIYEGSEEKAHCSLWDNLRLKWPQTILGREKAKCRRKAQPPTQVKIYVACAANILTPKQARACVFICVRAATSRTHLSACHPLCNASAPIPAEVMTDLVTSCRHLALLYR